MQRSVERGADLVEHPAERFPVLLGRGPGTGAAGGVGSLAGHDTALLRQMLPFFAVGTVLALSQARPLNALALGEDSGRALGAHVGRTRVLTALAVTLLCGAATATAGPIAFVGLAVPHLVRALTVTGAVAHVASNTIKGRVASQDDLLTLRDEGVPVETAGEHQAEPVDHDANRSDRGAPNAG